MDATRQGNNVVILCTDNDSGMRLRRLVQPDEVSAIESKHSPALADGERQYGSIGGLLTRLAGGLTGQHIVAEMTKFVNNRLGKILIGIKPSHGDQASSFSLMA
jgi:hypothetical protein